MKEWLTPSEMLALNKGELPASLRALNRHIERQGWRRDPVKARKAAGREGGGGWEYHITCLPGTMRARLEVASEGAPASDRDALWAAYDRLTEEGKADCRRRLEAVRRVQELTGAGLGETAAIQQVAEENGLASSTLFNWRRAVRGHRRADWLAALAPKYKGGGRAAECHEEAWQVLVSDWLRGEKPSFSTCYRRMLAAAKREGWQPIPSERALRRRLQAEVPRAVQVVAREGRDAAKRLYPAQRRDRTDLHAMQAVNMDGHKFDVFCQTKAGDRVRPILVAIQDLYSNKFVAWRLADAETKESVRLVIGDMVQRFGIPDHIYLDNGRAFTSKWISGGAPTRFRFKVKAEEPQGLLTALGTEIHWTTPYSGQSKPIERAFRDIADAVSRHPALAGAYTGNRPDAKPDNYASRAIEWEVFRDLVAEGIAEHNARTGRNTATAKGRSFDETFEASLADARTIIRWASPAQRSLWLLAAERIRAQKGSGEIHFQGNRYWDPALTQWAGKRVTIRFDPDDLFAGIKVYDAADRAICEAGCITDTGFADVESARGHARTRNALLKAVRDQHRATAAMSAAELARIYAGAGAEDRPAPRPKVVRIANGGTVAQAQEAAEWNEDHEKDFSRGLRLLSGGLDE